MSDGIQGRKAPAGNEPLAGGGQREAQSQPDTEAKGPRPGQGRGYLEENPGDNSIRNARASGQSGSDENPAVPGEPVETNLGRRFAGTEVSPPAGDKPDSFDPARHERRDEPGGGAGGGGSPTRSSDG